MILISNFRNKEKMWQKGIRSKLNRGKNMTLKRKRMVKGINIINLIHNPMILWIMEMNLMMRKKKIIN